MTSLDPSQQLAAWLRKRSTGTLLPEPPEELEADVVEAIYALQPHRAPGPRVGLDDILMGVQAGPFQGSLAGRGTSDDSVPEQLPSTPRSSADLPEPRSLASLTGAPTPGEGSSHDAPEPPTFMGAGGPDALDPVALHLEDSIPPLFDASAFNQALNAQGTSAELPGLETAQADALERWLEARGHGKPPESVESEVVEAIYAIRPDLAPPPRFELEDVLDAVETGPFSAGGEVVSLPLSPPTPVVVDDDPTLVPADDGRPAVGEEAPGAGVVSLADERRKRGLAWWAAPGLGVVLAAAAAVTFVVLPSLQGGNMADMAAPMEELAATDAPTAAPMARKSRMQAEVAEAGGGGAASTATLDDAFGAEQQPPSPEATLMSRSRADQAGDTGIVGAADLPSGSAGGDLGSGSTAAGPSTMAVSSEAEPTEALEALGYAEADEDSMDGLLADGDMAEGMSLRGASGELDDADERSLMEEKAKDLSQRTKRESAGRAYEPAPAVAAPEPSMDDAEAEELEATEYDYATTTNTGAVSNTGGAWGGEAPASLSDLRMEAITSSASPTRDSLRSQYPAVAQADAAAAEALGNSDRNGAVRELEVLLAHSDANVVMDTAFEIGRLLRDAGRNDLALAYIARGLGVAGGSTSQRSRLLALRGQILEARGDESGARRYYQESIDALEDY